MRIFAHRGFSGKYPENTMLAFEQAVKTGCGGIELDVQLTKDGFPVIIHDEKLDRTTNGSGDLRNYTYQELLAFHCIGASFQDGSQRIPTLREYFSYIRDTGSFTNIELKNSVYAYPGLEEKVFALIEEFKISDRILISSFNHDSILKCKCLNPSIPVAFLVGMGTELGRMAEYAKENRVEYCHPDCRLLTAEKIHQFHNLGIGVNVWTVNQKDEISRFLKLGVDGIITNFPDLAMEVLSGYEDKS